MADFLYFQEFLSEEDIKLGETIMNTQLRISYLKFLRKMTLQSIFDFKYYTFKEKISMVFHLKKYKRELQELNAEIAILEEELYDLQNK